MEKRDLPRRQGGRLDLRELEKALGVFDLKDALQIESFDRQYRALERLFNALGNEELFFKLALVNALLSYQLPSKGEVYWERFASFFSQRKDPTHFEEFLRLYNARFLGAKLRRLKKALRAVKKLDLKALRRLCLDPARLALFLAREMGQKPSDKTVLFAVKIFLYACRIAGGKAAVAPFELGVPLDSRLKKISPDGEFFNSLARKLNIPPLHLDAILWTAMGASGEFLNSLPPDLREKVEKLKKVLKSAG